MILPLVAASFAFAADKAPAKKEGSFGTGKAGGAYLTKEQLRACMSQQDKVKAQDADLLKEKAALAEQKTEITRIGDELKTRLETIDRSSAAAVDGYNEAVTARDKQIDAYQARVTAFNAGVDANQLAHDSFAQGCSSRRYFEEDEAAIRKGK
ncbi:MAG: hypothetical protein ABI781_07330 [Burkholderiales bacterium]